MQLPDPATEPTLDTERTAQLYGVSRWALYDAVREGRAPVTPLRIGNRLRWPTRWVLRSLGLEEEQ